MYMLKYIQYNNIIESYWVSHEHSGGDDQEFNRTQFV